MMNRVVALVTVLVSTAVIVLAPASCNRQEVPFKNEKPDGVPYEEPPVKSPDQPYVVGTDCRQMGIDGFGNPTMVLFKVWSDGTDQAIGPC